MSPQSPALSGSGLLLLSPRRGGTLPDWRGITGLREGGHPTRDGTVCLTWGHDLPRVGDGFLLVREPIVGGSRLRVHDAAQLVSDSVIRSAQPPFAAAVPTGAGWTLRQDALGFRLLYRREAPGWAAVSTSARALSLLAPSGLDEGTLAVVSLLGWPLADRTPWREVRVLRHGVALAGGDTDASDGGGALPGLEGGEPVATAARILRTTLEAFLDENPTAVLQLTGGVDSRILLAAIPRARRAAVQVMTLRTSGSRDASIASALAARYGMRHTIRSFSEIATMSAEQAFGACMAAALRLEGSADPIAAACVEVAEGQRGEQTRIVGLGGEVARGFYYVGPLWADHVGERRIRRFADWRLFANEAAPREMFTTEFASWAAEEARRQVRQTLLEPRGSWFELTDAFYLDQRMRRWAGGLASTTCLERVDMNPMLDPRFVGLVTGLRPSEKVNLRFLARLLDHLDPELTALPLDGRPAPSVYLRASSLQRAGLVGMATRKVIRKVGQRLTSTTRSSEGGDLLTEKVVAHLRSDPGRLDPAVATGFLDPVWVERLCAGELRPTAAAVAHLMTLLASAMA